MTKEEAIENLKGCVCGYEVGKDGKPNGNVTADLTQETIDMAIKALEAPPNDNWEGYSKRLWKSAYERGKADAEQRWIPVSERLPEERDWYLAVFKESDTGFQLIPRVADYIGRGENKWQLMDEDGLSSEYRELLECIAWMPLPEPYKAESEEV